ncbi:MAG: hypothetical protein ACC656_08445 [Candidatus Heimdallarchaeota archaeon]
MSSRLDFFRNSDSKIDRKKLIVIIIISLLLLSILISATVYKISKESNQKALENAEFSIDSFDILNASADSIWIEFRLNITNLDSSRDSSLVNSDYIEIALLNNSEIIAEIIVPLDSSDFEESTVIQTEIFLDPSNESNDNSLLGGLISNILSGNNFIIDFRGTVYYDVSNAFSDSLKFSNQILFVVNNTALDLEIVEIILESLDSKSAQLILRISNSFSTEFTTFGTVFTSLEDFNLGEIDLDEGLSQ